MILHCDMPLMYGIPMCHLVVEIFSVLLLHRWDQPVTIEQKVDMARPSVLIN